MAWLLIAGIAAALLWLLAWLVLNTPAATIVRTLRWTVVVVLVAAVLGLLAVGLFRPTLLPGFMLIPLIFPWRRRRGPSADVPGPAPGDAPVEPMTREEAAEILGVAVDAPRDDVLAAHGRQRAARETGGGASSWALARIDRARDVLLGNGEP